MEEGIFLFKKSKKVEREEEKKEESVNVNGKDQNKKLLTIQKNKKKILKESIIDGHRIIKESLQIKPKVMIYFLLYLVS